MSKKKRIWFSLMLLIVFLTPMALDQHAAQNSIGTRADGTAPPPKPIPYELTLGGNLSADGTSPPAPPIPYVKTTGEATVL